MALICDDLGVNRDSISPSSSFIRDIGADSLDIVEFTMALEEEFGVAILDWEAEKIRTVGDLIDYVYRHQSR